MLFEPSGELSGTIGWTGLGKGRASSGDIRMAFQYLPPDTLVVWDSFLTSIRLFRY